MPLLGQIYAIAKRSMFPVYRVSHTKRKIVTSVFNCDFDDNIWHLCWLSSGETVMDQQCHGWTAVLFFSLLRSAIRCIRGAHSSPGHPIRNSPIPLVTSEAELPMVVIPEGVSKFVVNYHGAIHRMQHLFLSETVFVSLKSVQQKPSCAS